MRVRRTKQWLTRDEAHHDVHRVDHDINDAPREGPVGLTRVRVSWAGGFIRQHSALSSKRSLIVLDCSVHNATAFDEGFVSPSRFRKIYSIRRTSSVALLLSYF